MKTLIILLLLAACAGAPPKSPGPIPENVSEDLVTVQTALDQARSSYLLGCVMAYKEMKVDRSSFSHCVEKARAHREELLIFMQGPIRP